MNYFERYEKIVKELGWDPCSKSTADKFGLTRATISSWSSKSTTPKGETVAIMADVLGVSADYLLGRTDDPTDYTKQEFPKKTDDTPEPPVIEQVAPPVIEQITPPVIKQIVPEVTSPFLALYDRLDDNDKIRVEGVIHGMLMQDKYAKSALPNAAHARTDIPVTPEMVEHDEEIMDDDEF